MGKLYSVAVGIFVAMLISSTARADGADISAQRLLASWHDEDPGMKMVAEVIASAFRRRRGKATLLQSARSQRVARLWRGRLARRSPAARNRAKCPAPGCCQAPGKTARCAGTTTRRVRALEWAMGAPRRVDSATPSFIPRSTQKRRPGGPQPLSVRECHFELVNRGQKH